MSAGRGSNSRVEGEHVLSRYPKGVRPKAFEALLNQVEFIRSLTDAKNEVEFGRRIKLALKTLGFNDFFISGVGLGQPFTLSYSTLPKSVFNTYRRRKYYEHDMSFDYIRGNTQDAIYLSDIEKSLGVNALVTETSKINLAIVEFYRGVKIGEIYFIPLKVSDAQGGDWGGAREVFAVVSRGGDPSFKENIESAGALLLLLADAISYIRASQFSLVRPEGAMSDKSLKLLTTLAKNDLTLNDAAELLGISIDTANKQMAKAKRWLGTRSQANAIYLAIKAGLIDLE